MTRRWKPDAAWIVRLVAVSCGYLYYAARAGFHFDDFFFYDYYRDKAPAFWDYQTNFGRILTR